MITPRKLIFAVFGLRFMSPFYKTAKFFEHKLCAAHIRRLRTYTVYKKEGERKKEKKGKMGTKFE